MLGSRQSLITEKYKRHKSVSMSICSGEKAIMSQTNKIWKKIENLFNKSQHDSTLTILIGMTTGEHYGNKGKVYYRFLQQREWSELTKKNVRYPKEVWKILRKLASEKGLIVREFDTIIDKRYSNDPCIWSYFIQTV